MAQHRDESIELALVGELDMAATFKLESELERLLARHEVRELVLDLADLTFIDSSGVGALLAIRDRCESLGVALHLTKLSHPVRRILDLSGTGPLLPIETG